MNNLRFATLVHIFVLLQQDPEEWLSSEYIAGSININPVIVRKEIALLKSNGYVESKKGKVGGARLTAAAQELSLGDILRLISEDEQVIHKKNNPNPACPIGKQMNQKLDEIYQTMNQTLFAQLDTMQLADLATSMKQLN